MNKILVRSFIALLLTTYSLVFVSPSQCETGKILKRDEQLNIDSNSVITSRKGLEDVIDYVNKNPDIFVIYESTTQKMVTRENRVLIWEIWLRFLEHIFYLDFIGQQYSDLYQEAKGKKVKAELFRVSFAAFLSQYRYAMDFIEKIEKNPEMHVMLNESVPEFGLVDGSYSILKYRFLNVLRGAEFARLNILYKLHRSPGDDTLSRIIDEDIQAIWQAGKGKGPSLTVQNGGRILADLGFSTWFPVQKGVSKMLGNTKVWRHGDTLISLDQINELRKKLLPGDILLQRREWYATNVGIPGFWPHAALFIGTPKERAEYFSDSELSELLAEQGNVDRTFESLLKKLYPEAYLKNTTVQLDGYMPSVIEAIEEGVSFTTLEHSAAADSLVVLRPAVSRKVKAKAILKSFHYSGRPYDFNFDFRTDSELVCSELIYKAYEKTDSSEGLDLPVSEVLGRKLLSPNNIARLFSEEYGTDGQQLQFVIFLDGNEISRKAVESDVDTFMTSWKRPKWHIWIQDMEKKMKKNDSSRQEKNG